MCEANFRVFHHYDLCYIVINMVCFFFLGLGVCMLDVHCECWYKSLNQGYICCDDG
jgi:hypothetical protein